MVNKSPHFSSSNVVPVRASDVSWKGDLTVGVRYTENVLVSPHCALLRTVALIVVTATEGFNNGGEPLQSPPVLTRTLRVRVVERCDEISQRVDVL